MARSPSASTPTSERHARRDARRATRAAGPRPRRLERAATKPEEQSRHDGPLRVRVSLRRLRLRQSREQPQGRRRRAPGRRRQSGRQGQRLRVQGRYLVQGHPVWLRLHGARLPRERHAEHESIRRAASEGQQPPSLSVLPRHHQARAALLPHSDGAGREAGTARDGEEGPDSRGGLVDDGGRLLPRAGGEGDAESRRRGLLSHDPGPFRSRERRRAPQPGRGSRRGARPRRMAPPVGLRVRRRSGPAEPEGRRSSEVAGKAQKHGRFVVEEEADQERTWHTSPAAPGAVRRDEVRVARFSKRPSGVPANGKWIHVDLAEQTLVAYEGDKPSTRRSSRAGKKATSRQPASSKFSRSTSRPR